MNQPAFPILDSSPVAKFTAIIQQDPYAQMIDYLMTTAERAALAAEREAAKAKPTKRKRGRPRKTCRKAKCERKTP